MLQVFRVEHESTQLGPFQTPDDFTQTLAKRAAATRDLRVPGEDGLPLGYLPFKFVFGCGDLAALKRWFCLGGTDVENEEIIQELKRRGFRLLEFLVEEGDYRVGLSGLQVAFDPSLSREESLFQAHDLATLLAYPAALAH